MNKRVLLTVCIALLFLPWVSIAQAEENYRFVNVDMNISHGMRGAENVERVNLLGDPQTEYGTWPEHLRMVDGLYWGNLIPASTASLGIGTAVRLRSVIRIPQTDIASGASEVLIRVPFDGNTVEYLQFKVDGIVYENVTEQPLSTYTLFHNNQTRRIRMDDRIFWDHRGIFIRLTHCFSTTYKHELSPAGNTSGGALLYPDTETFVFDVIASPYQGQYVSVLLSEEEYTVHDEFWVYLRDVHISRQEPFRRTIPATPAWAFVFVEGLSKTNSFSFGHPANRGDGVSNEILLFLRVNNAVDPEWVGNYTTVHIPFLGTSSWSIHFQLNGAEYGAPLSSTSFAATVTAREGFLTITPPAPIAWANPTWTLTVTLSHDEDIRLFSAFDKYMRYNLVDTGVDPYADYWLFTYLDAEWVGNRMYLWYEFPIWSNIWMTEGVYTALHWIGGQLSADFHWGRGYIYPGEMVVLIQIDQQTEVYWKGNVEVLYGGILTKDVSEYSYSELEALVRLHIDPDKIPPDPEDDDRDIWQKIIDAILGVVSWLVDGVKGLISTVFSYIIGALEWLGNFVIDMVGKVIAFMKNVAEFLGNTLKGILWGLPPTLILLSLAYSGNADVARETVRESMEKVEGQFEDPAGLRRRKARVSAYVGEQRAKRAKRRQERLELESMKRERRKQKGGGDE